MPYRLKRSESVPGGLKRIVGEQIETALKQLNGKNTNRDEAIHEARKSIKKIRGVLRLVEPELGTTYRVENDCFRKVGRKLSEFRDAAATIEIFDDLRERFRRDLGADTLASIRHGLLTRKRQFEQQAPIDQTLDQITATLQAASKRVKTWPIQADGFAAIAPGLEKTYRRSRNAMEPLPSYARPDNYHKWRRCSKYHRYHIQLLQSVWAEMMQAYASSLKDLDTWLGNDHNLVVLRDRIVAEPEFYGKEREIDLLLSLIDKYEKLLRESALSLGERTYDRKPGEFARLMNHLWRAWKSQPRSFEKLVQEKQGKQSKTNSQRAA